MWDFPAAAEGFNLRSTSTLLSQLSGEERTAKKEERVRNRAGLNFTENYSASVYGTQKIDSQNSEMRRLEKKMLVDSVAALLLLLLLPLAGEKRMAPIWSFYVRSALRRIE